MEFIAWLKTNVSTWTENTMLDGQEPTYEGFVAEFKEYDHEELIEPIVEEMERIKKIVSFEVLAW